MEAVAISSKHYINVDYLAFYKLNGDFYLTNEKIITIDEFTEEKALTLFKKLNGIPDDISTFDEANKFPWNFFMYAPSNENPGETGTIRCAKVLNKKHIIDIFKTEKGLTGFAMNGVLPDKYPLVAWPYQEIINIYKTKASPPEEPWIDISKEDTPPVPDISVSFTTNKTQIILHREFTDVLWPQVEFTPEIKKALTNQELPNMDFEFMGIKATYTCGVWNHVWEIVHTPSLNWPENFAPFNHVFYWRYSRQEYQVKQSDVKDTMIEVNVGEHFIVKYLKN